MIDPRTSSIKSVAPQLPGINACMTLSDFRSARQANLMLKAPPSVERISPDYPGHLSNVPCPLPRRIETGAYVDCFPIPRGLPRYSSGSASTTSLSRPAQASLAVRPLDCSTAHGGLCRKASIRRSPGQIAYQLPDQSATLWVESSSTGDPRLRGALPTADIPSEC